MPTNALRNSEPPQSPSAVRVLIVAAVRLYREGMSSCLDKRDELTVIGTAATCEAALDRAAALAPDIVLIDTATDRGVELVRALRDATPPVKTVLFAVENDDGAIIACAEAGAAGYLPSDASLDDVTATLVRAARGELLCPPMVAAALMRHVGAGAAVSRDHPALVGLTSREREVLALIDAGLSNKEIAVRLRIEVATVKNHVHHLLDKLKVTSRGAAAARLGARQALRRSAR
jgi:two-component system, NarL family, nitrate/nitrite response regulator NarL